MPACKKFFLRAQSTRADVAVSVRPYLAPLASALACRELFLRAQGMHVWRSTCVPGRPHVHRLWPVRGHRCNDHMVPKLLLVHELPCKEHPDTAHVLVVGRHTDARARVLLKLLCREGSSCLLSKASCMRVLTGHGCTHTISRPTATAYVSACMHVNMCVRVCMRAC